MDRASIEREMDRLTRERSALMARVDMIERQMSAVRQTCAHEIDDFPDAWWCRYCGAEVKKSA